MKLFKLLLPFLFLCFAIGFGIGAFPDRWRELRGLSTHHLQLLVSDVQLVPPQILDEYEKSTGDVLEVKVVETYHLYRTEAQNADLLLAPLSWLHGVSDLLKELPNQEQNLSLLSSDFQSLKLDLKIFFPVLWKTETQGPESKLLIWGFATPQKSTPEALQFLKFLIQDESHLLTWAKMVKLNFTLQKSNTLKNFPENQRAENLRQLQLSHLVIDQKAP